MTETYKEKYINLITALLIDNKMIRSSGTYSETQIEKKFNDSLMPKQINDSITTTYVRFNPRDTFNTKMWDVNAE